MIHAESKIQQECVFWFRLQYPRLRLLLFSVPNGGARRKIEGRIMKAEGTVRGVSDLILLFPARGYHALCIEMKTAKGVQQQSQCIWQKAVEDAGCKYVICRSFDDFREQINAYLK